MTTGNYTYSLTGADDGSGPRFDTREEAEAACREFIGPHGVDCGGIERVTEFEDWMVVEVE